MSALPANDHDAEAFLKAVAENKPLRTGRIPFLFKSEAEMMKHLNSFIAVGMLGDEVRIIVELPDQPTKFLREAQARSWLSQYKVAIKQRDKTVKWEPAFKHWLPHPHRRQYSAIVFRPEGAQPSEYNLWTGYAVEPKPGSWGRMETHLREIICSGDDALYAWLKAWLAQMFQEPWRKTGVAVLLRGAMGTGKSKFSDWLGKIIGNRHAPAIDRPEHLTGRFNGHLEEALLARVEEGFYPGDPASKAALKHLITSEWLMVERKGVGCYQSRNSTRVLITTNADWAVPAAPGERRYLVVNVSDARQQQSAYFAAIDDEMENGGAEAMLYDLLHHDFSGVDLRNPPRTKGLVEQIVEGFTADQQWWLTVLTEGRFPFTDGSVFRLQDCEWPAGEGLVIDKSLVCDSYREHVPGYRGVPASPERVGAFLRKWSPGLTQGRSGPERVRQYRFPALDALRIFFTAGTGYVFVDEDDDAVLSPVAPAETAARRWPPLH